MEGLHSVSSEEKNEGLKEIIANKFSRTPTKKNSYGSTSTENYENKVKETEEDNDISNDVPRISTSFSATIGLTVAAIFISVIMLLAITGKNWDFGSDSTIVSPKTSMNYDKAAYTTASPRSEEVVSSGTITVISTTDTTVTTNPTDIVVNPSDPTTVTTDPTTVTTDPTIVTVDPSVTTTLSSPNFVFIVADDLGWNSVGYTNSKLEFATPQMTALAKKGIIMDNFYAQEVCSPSRASLLTGRYPLSSGMQYGMVAATAEWGLPLDEITIAEVLSDNGYETHMLGKWHLGFFSPLFLPTARGFDTYLGYVNGENYYWSKRSPDYPQHVDMMESTTSCYTPYEGTDKHDYSTIFYTDKTLELLEEKAVSTSGNPFFLYLAFQAVHDPFTDKGKFTTGMPDSYFDDEPTILSTIHSEVKGKQRQEYIKSLYMLDKSIGQIYDKLEETELMDDTYLIFMSDNGGCFHGGGKNGPLRGSKGSLYEGGIRVDSWIYSPRLNNQGVVYSNLFHVSDWFPTILALAAIEYVPDSDHPLDGVNQVQGWIDSTTQPRTSMLYNMYLYLTDYDFNIWTNGSFAVRDNRFKLMHTYNDTDYGAWYDEDTEYEGDDDFDSDERCAQQFLTGDFVYYLFDLDEDPYETNNLYYSDDETYTMVKEQLYQLLPGYEARATTKISIHWSKHAEVVWESYGNNILPWADTEKLVNGEVYEHPVYCSSLR